MMRTRDQLVTDALRKCGALGDGETAAAAQLAAGANAINALIKAWAAHGLQIWKMETVESLMSLMVDEDGLTVGVLQEIVTSNLPLKLISAYRYDTLSEVSVPLTIEARERFFDLPNLTSEGAPVTVYFQPLKTTGIFYAWPLPDGHWSTNGVFKLDFQVQFTNTTTGSDVLDMPDHWEEALIYNLAARLAPEYGLSINDRNVLKMEAKETLQLALDFSNEEGSIFIRPNRVR
jgi:hypothetical protein